MKDKIIHLTHTDILKDSRVLKEVAALTKAGYTLMGSGISMSDGLKNGTEYFGAGLLNIQLNADEILIAFKRLKVKLVSGNLMI